MLAIGVKEKEEKRAKEEDSNCLEDSIGNSQLKSSDIDKQASRTLEASSLAEAWKLRTSCCNNLAACHFQVISLKDWALVHFMHIFSGATMLVLLN